MNGFIIFKTPDAVEKFLASPRITNLKSDAQFERSAQDPLIIFRKVLPEELSTIRELAGQFGGDTRESIQYHPF
ncbi:MAG: hypothetical protein ABR501_05650 [Pyrinomonadaceae bacterium]